MKLHQNRKFLLQKYVEENLSTSEIAKITGVDARTIRYWMGKYNIPRKNHSLYAHLSQKNSNPNLPQEAFEFIDGELLGDASIQVRSIYASRINYASRHRHYVEWLKTQFDSWGIKSGKVRIRKIHLGYTSKIFTAYYFDTYAYSIFNEFRNRFYPNGKKIVPEDIELTPLTVRQWYIGDGSLIKSGKCKPYIALFTCGFTKEDVLFLMSKLDLIIQFTFRQSLLKIFWIILDLVQEK